MKIGFIGLGRMGKHMATNVVKAGFETYVNDLVPALVDQLVALGAKHSPTNQELAASVDVAFTMLPNGAIVESVMCGPQGVLAACKPGTIIVDMSSVAPATTQKMAEIAAKHGVKYIDAPVSGGTAGAEAGTLTIMVGAEQETFDKVKPVLEAIGKLVKYNSVEAAPHGRRHENRQQHAAGRQHGLPGRGSGAGRQVRPGPRHHV